HDDAVRLTAPDGAVALVRVRFGPVGEHPDLRTALLDHVGRDRLVGAILVRRGGHAMGVFDGRQLRTSKVGRGYVQGRTKAGGWSQQRYARRRTQQAEQAYAAAADTAAQILLPVANDLEAVVGGGDRSGVDAVLADPRLAPLRRLLTGRVLATADPRLDVLRRFGDQLRQAEIALNELA
ncbi:MAG TPA: acVLRF1 family peptidyl-tRNA hydrolase, partial [Propionibacteriaceae bacterium]|nr:acVLRF1 family peptidyl-tRNA hydrolase [Propionibacteriaceae bacterium]